ncbi:MAG: transposase [Thiotrichales bacterium]
MARPLRLEFPGALYHLTARGDRREAIFFDDDDRDEFLTVLGDVCRRFNWVVYAYCLMPNHYHLFVETVDGNLGRGMRQLNGVYTQRINRRYTLSGHLFQGRYKAILVQKDTYLLELARYLVLNPVRVGLVSDPAEWPWSSYRATVGEVPPPAWLDAKGLLAHFGRTRGRAIAAYRRFVLAGMEAPRPWGQVRYQLILGDDDFVARLRNEATDDRLLEVTKLQRKSLALALPEYAERFRDRAEAMAQAYHSGAYTMAEIASHFGVHSMTVSRAVKCWGQVLAGRADRVPRQAQDER